MLGDVETVDGDGLRPDHLIRAIGVASQDALLQGVDTAILWAVDIRAGL
jgi:hypothetical protein